MPRPARLRINATGILVMVGMAAVWELVARAGLLNIRFLPKPTEILGVADELLLSSELWSSTAHTLRIALTSWLIAAGAGIAVGLLLGLWRPAWQWSMASIEILRAMPAIAFLPVAIILLGLSDEMELAIVIYSAFWPVCISTVAGTQDTSPILADVATTFHLSRIQYVLRMALPAAAGPVMVGLRLALTTSLVVAVVAEMIARPKGLGYQVVFEQHALEVATMFGYIIVIGILAIALNSSLRWATRRLLPGIGVTGVDG